MLDEHCSSSGWPSTLSERLRLGRAVNEAHFSKTSQPDSDSGFQCAFLSAAQVFGTTRVCTATLKFFRIQKCRSLPFKVVSKHWLLLSYSEIDAFGNFLTNLFGKEKELNVTTKTC